MSGKKHTGGHSRDRRGQLRLEAVQSEPQDRKTRIFEMDPAVAAHTDDAGNITVSIRRTVWSDYREDVPVGQEAAQSVPVSIAGASAYAFYIHNSGDADAVVRLDVAPDEEHYFTVQEIVAGAGGTALLPNDNSAGWLPGKTARLSYYTASGGDTTVLTIGTAIQY